MEVIHSQIFQIRIFLVFISVKKNSPWSPDEQSLEIFRRRNLLFFRKIWWYCNERNETEYTCIFSGFYTRSIREKLSRRATGLQKKYGL